MVTHIPLGVVKEISKEIVVRVTHIPLGVVKKISKEIVVVTYIPLGFIIRFFRLDSCHAFIVSKIPLRSLKFCRGQVDAIITYVLRCINVIVVLVVIIIIINTYIINNVIVIIVVMVTHMLLRFIITHLHLDSSHVFRVTQMSLRSLKCCRGQVNVNV